MLVPDVDLASLAPDDGEGEVDPNFNPEEAAALEMDMNNALALNQQLKEMLLQAEAREAEQQQLARAIAARGGRGGGGPAARGGRGMSGIRAPGASMMRGAAPENSRQAPRMLGHAKNGGWGGLTHTDGRSNEIERDNQILVSKLTSIAVKPTLNTRQNMPVRQNPAQTTVAINRRKQDDKIARENARMAQRLNSVKATSTLSNKSAAQHAKQHNAHLRVLGGAGNSGYNPMMAPPRQPGSRAASATSYRPNGQQALPRLMKPPRPFE